MSSTVDERIVEMRFDNKDFEKGVAQTIKSLDSLKENLKFDDAAKSSLTSLEKAVNQVNFEELNKAIDKVGDRFTVLGTIASRVLENIADDAYRSGKSLLKNLTVDQISNGWSKYETKLGSVQTIMAALADSSEGTMENVTTQLEKLNWFTDETSYNFIAMVDTIGKFTSNGIRLDDSITSIMGISTAAALAGANASDATHAMEGFAKTMANGTMNRMNWAWIKTAHMDTKMFKEQLLEAAASLGTLQKAENGVYKTLKGHTVTYQDFESNLSDNWLTKEALNKALTTYGAFANKLNEISVKTGLTATELLQSIDKYANGTLDLSKLSKEVADNFADDGGVEGAYAYLSKVLPELNSDVYAVGRKAFKAAQEAKTFTDAINSVKDAVSTGWMNTFEYLFGNYEESKSMWTNLANDLYDIFMPGIEARNELLSDWHVLGEGEGGYKDFIAGATGYFKGFKNIIDSVRAAIAHVFPPTTLDALKKFTLKFRSLGEKFQEITGFIAPVKDAVEDTTESINKNVGSVVDTVTSAGQTISDIARLVIRGDYGNGEARIKALESLGYSFEAVQNKVNELLGCSKRYSIQEGTVNLATGKLIKTTNNLAKANDKAATSSTDLSSATNDVSESVDNAADNVEEAMTMGQKFHNTLTGMLSIVGLVADAIKAVAKIVVIPAFTYIVPRVLNLILTITSKIGLAITSVVDKIRASKFIEVMLTNLVNKIVKVKDIAVSTFKAIANLDSVKAVTEALSKIPEAIINIANSSKDALGGMFSTLDSVIGKIPFKNTIVSVFDKVAKGVGAAISYISPLFDTTRKIFNGFSTLFGASVQKGLNNVVNGFKLFGDKLNTVLTAYSKAGKNFATIQKQFKIKTSTKANNGVVDVLEKIFPDKGIKEASTKLTSVQKMYKSGKGLWSDIVGEITEASGPVDILKALSNGFKNASSSIFKATHSFFQPALDALEPGVKKLKNIFDGFASAFDGLKLEDITRLATAISIFVGVYKFGKLVDGCAGVFDGIAGIFTSIKRTIKFKAISKVALEMASALAIVAGAIYVLSTIKTDKLWDAVEALAVMSIILTVMLGVLVVLAKTDKAAIGLSSIAIFSAMAAIATLATSLKIVSEVVSKGSHNLVTSLEILGVLAFMLLGVVFTLLELSKLMGGNKSQFGQLAGNAILIYGFAAACKKMVEALVEISEMDIDAINKSMLTLLEVVGTLSILAVASTALPKGAGINMIAMVGSIWLLMKVMEKINSSNVIDQAMSNLDKYSVLLAMIIGLALVARLAGEGGKSLAATLIGIGVSLQLMASAMKSISTLRPEQIVMATTSLVALIGMLTVFAYFSNKTTTKLMKGEKTSKLFGTLVGLGACMLALATAIRIIGTMEAADVLKGTLAVGALLILMTTVIKATSNSGKAQVSIIAITVMLALLSATILALSAIPVEKALTATACLSAIFLSFGVVLKAISALRGQIFPAIAFAATLGILLYVITYSLEYLANLQNVGTLLPIALSIAAVMTALGVVAGSMLVLGNMFGANAMMTVINGGMALMTAFGVIAIIVTLLATIPLDAYDTAIAAVHKVSELALEIGIAIGNLLGGILGGLLGGTIAGVLSGIEKFGEVAKSLSDIFKDIPDDVIDKAKKFSELVVILAGAGLKSSLDNLIGCFTGKSGLDTLTEGLPKLGKALFTFAVSILPLQFMSDKVFDTAVSASKALSDVLANIPRSGGLVQKVVGEVSWSSLSTGLVEYANALVEFAKAVEPLNDSTLNSALNSAIEASKSFTEVLKALPTDTELSIGWGLVSYSKDTGSWKTLSDGLSDYGDALNNFANKVSGFSDKTITDIDRAMQISSKFAEFLEALAPFGSSETSVAWGLFTKKDDNSINFTELSNGLGTFADAMSSFANKFHDISPKDIVKSMNILVKFSEMATNFAGGGDYQYAGFNGWDYYVKGLNNVVDPIKTLIDNTKDIQLTNVMNISSIFMTMASMFDEVTATPNDVTSYGIALLNLSSDLNTVFTNLSGFTSENVDTSLMQSLINDIGVMGETLLNLDMTPFQTFGSNIVTAISNGMKSDSASEESSDLTGQTGLGGQLVQSVQYLLDQVVTRINTVCLKQIPESGINIASAIAKGMVDPKTSLTNIQKSVSTLIDAFTQKIRGQEMCDQYYGAGKFVVLGFADGLKDDTAIQAVAANAASVAQVALDTIKSTCDENSPSKITTGFGRFLTLGFANGITEDTDIVASSAENMANKALSSIQGMINGLNYTSGVIAPSITPVMDLSSARLASGKLNAMMSRNQALSASASFNLNAQNDDVARLVAIGNKLLQSVQNGSDLYLDENVLVGRINRRLGQL